MRYVCFVLCFVAFVAAQFLAGVDEAAAQDPDCPFPCFKQPGAGSDTRPTRRRTNRPRASGPFLDFRVGQKTSVQFLQGYKYELIARCVNTRHYQRLANSIERTDTSGWFRTLFRKEHALMVLSARVASDTDKKLEPANILILRKNVKIAGLISGLSGDEDVNTAYLRTLHQHIFSPGNTCNPAGHVIGAFDFEGGARQTFELAFGLFTGTSESDLIASIKVGLAFLAKDIVGPVVGLGGAGRAKVANTITKYGDRMEEFRTKIINTASAALDANTTPSFQVPPFQSTLINGMPSIVIHHRGKPVFRLRLRRVKPLLPAFDSSEFFETTLDRFYSDKQSGKKNSIVAFVNEDTLQDSDIENACQTLRSDLGGDGGSKLGSLTRAHLARAAIEQRIGVNWQTAPLPILARAYRCLGAGAVAQLHSSGVFAKKYSTVVREAVALNRQTQLLAKLSKAQALFAQFVEDSDEAQFYVIDNIGTAKIAEMDALLAGYNKELRLGRPRAAFCGKIRALVPANFLQVGSSHTKLDRANGALATYILVLKFKNELDPNLTRAHVIDCLGRRHFRWLSRPFPHPDAGDPIFKRSWQSYRSKLSDWQSAEKRLDVSFDAFEMAVLDKSLLAIRRAQDLNDNRDKHLDLRIKKFVALLGDHPNVIIPAQIEEQMKASGYGWQDARAEKVEKFLKYLFVERQGVERLGCFLNASEKIDFEEERIRDSGKARTAAQLLFSIKGAEKTKDADGYYVELVYHASIRGESRYTSAGTFDAETGRIVEFAISKARPELCRRFDPRRMPDATGDCGCENYWKFWRHKNCGVPKERLKVCGLN